MSGLYTLAAAAVVSAGTGIASSISQGHEASVAEGLAQTTAGEQQYYNSLLEQLISNPSSVSTLPGFQFDLSTGSAAIAAGEGPSGHLGSGNEGAALEQFGQGLASSFYGQQTSLLASLSGVTNASSPSQSAAVANSATQGQASTISSLLNSLGFFGMLARGTPGGAPAGTPASLPAGSQDVTPGYTGSVPVSDPGAFVF